MYLVNDMFIWIITESTNLEARRLAQQGAEEGTGCGY